MSEKSRNFRASYYDKVGFRSVEEKKSLEILMNEKPMDKEKLSKFCLRFILPSMYREYVWQVLLGVLPVNLETQNSVMNQKQEHYSLLEKSVKIQFRLKEVILAELHTIIFLTTDDIIEFTLDKLSTPKCRKLIAIASFFHKLSSSDLVAYYLFRNFIHHQRKYASTLNSNSMKENFETILRKDDEVLYEHLKSTNLLDKLPVCAWFETCFTEVLHENSLARVFDKVIGGSFKILPYVATALLVGNRHLLLALTDASKIPEIFENVSEDASDVAVNKALEMFQFAAVLERETEQYRNKTIAKS